VRSRGHTVGGGSRPPSHPPQTAHAERSTWERVTVSPNVEVHVRRPLSRIENKRLERLLEVARTLFTKGDNNT